MNHKRLMPDFRQITPGQNPNWPQSAYLGLVASVVFAPSHLINSLREPLSDIFFGSLKLIVALLIWSLSRPTLLVAGFIGRLRLRELPKVEGQGK